MTEENKNTNATENNQENAGGQTNLEEKVEVKLFFNKIVKVKPKWVKPLVITKKVLTVVGGTAAIAGAGFVGYKFGVRHIGALKDIEIGKLKKTIDEIKRIELPKPDVTAAIETAADVAEAVTEVVEETV